MHFLPRSLSGRLILILLTGLIGAQFLAATLSLYERDRAMIYFSDQWWAQHYAEVVHLMETLPAEERPQVAIASIMPRLIVTLSRKPLPDSPGSLPEDTAAARFQAKLQRLLPGHIVYGYLLRIPIPGEERDTPFELGYRIRSVTGVRLTDGNWVYFNFLRPLRPFAVTEWPYPLLVYLAVLLAAVVLLLLIAVRLTTRPLTVMAAAAEKFGRDINQPPLPERGPTEVREATHAFNEMRMRLRRYVEDRTHLLTAISHDLRTPITRLRLRSELLDDEELKQKFNHDLQEVEDMTVATLEFLRGLNVSESSQPMDLMALLETLQADAVEMKHAVTVRGTISSPFRGQPRALRRCLENLLNNAIRYGGRTELRVREAGDKVEIVVRDYGSGIPEDQLEKVFEPYYRLDNSRSRTGGGTGLGLSIARNIAVDHGGELILRNHAGGGLEAVLTLPRNPESA